MGLKRRTRRGTRRRTRRRTRRGIGRFVRTLDFRGVLALRLAFTRIQRWIGIGIGRFLGANSTAFELEFGASEQVLDPAVVQQGSKQRAIPNGLEVLEHVDVADIEEIDESDGFDLQQERKTQQKVHAVHSDVLLDVEHAMHAVDGAEDSLGSREGAMVLRT